MLYSIICYHSEDVVAAWPREKDEKVMAGHCAVLERLAAQGKNGTGARLMPTTTATTIRKGRNEIVIDGPFAETKEQLLGFYIVDCESLDEAIDVAKELVIEGGAMEIRPVLHYQPGRTQTGHTQAESRAS
jgi:hypothetical protein